jgi:hypothetical protein
MHDAMVDVDGRWYSVRQTTGTGTIPVLYRSIRIRAEQMHFQTYLLS